MQECFTIFVVGCLILILHQVYKLWDLVYILSTISGFHVIHMFWGHQHYERKPLNWTTFGINQSCRSQPLSRRFKRTLWWIFPPCLIIFLGNKAAPAKRTFPPLEAAMHLPSVFSSTYCSCYLWENDREIVVVPTELEGTWQCPECWAVTLQESSCWGIHMKKDMLFWTQGLLGCKCIYMYFLWWEWKTFAVTNDHHPHYHY